jgi:hypothetical protein
MPDSSKQSSKQKTGVLYLLILSLSKYLRINTIVYLPVVLASLVLVVSFILGEQIYKNSNVPDSFIGATLVIMWLTASVSGFIQITIQEIPGFLFPVEGKAAILFGVFWIILFWLMGILTIWYYFL